MAVVNISVRLSWLSLASAPSDAVNYILHSSAAYLYTAAAAKCVLLILRLITILIPCIYVALTQVCWLVGQMSTNSQHVCVCCVFCFRVSFAVLNSFRFETIILLSLFFRSPVLLCVLILRFRLYFIVLASNEIIGDDRLWESFVKQQDWLSFPEKYLNHVNKIILLVFSLKSSLSL